MWVTMFPSVPEQVFCVNYSNSLSCCVTYWGLCTLFNGIAPSRASGEQTEYLLGFLFPAFILAKADKSSEPVDLYAMKTSKEMQWYAG